MDMAGKMSGIDMHGASGHEDARNLRNATGAGCSLPVGVNSKSGELPERVPLSGHGRVEQTSDGTEPTRSPEPKWYQPFRAGHGARFRRLAASLFMFAALGTALPAAAQTAITLISNSGQTNGDEGALSSYDQAQAFTTGANAAGYTITGIDIQFEAYTGSRFIHRVHLDRDKREPAAALSPASQVRPASLPQH